MIDFVIVGGQGNVQYRVISEIPSSSQHLSWPGQNFAGAMTPSQNYPCCRGTSYYSHCTVLEYSSSYADDWETQREESLGAAI